MNRSINPPLNLIGISIRQNMAKENHKPDHYIKHHDGRTYIVKSNGSWVRVSSSVRK